MPGKSGLATFAAVAVMLVVAACGGEKEPGPREAVDGFLSSVLEGNAAHAATYLPQEAAAEFMAEFEYEGDAEENAARTLLGAIAYEIGEVIANGTKASVEVEITSPDIAVVATQTVKLLVAWVLEEGVSSATDAKMEVKMLELMTEVLEGSDHSAVAVGSTVALTLVDGAWLLDAGAAGTLFAPIIKEWYERLPEP